MTVGTLERIVAEQKAANARQSDARVGVRRPPTAVAVPAPL
jgi:hypothetical protein